jgi:glycosyltransferase involved in cell wall biosynthesis
MSEKKRIGMVVHAYYLRDARVIRYGEALANAGHEVSVICLQDPNDLPYERVNGVDIHRVKFERRRGGKLWYILEYVIAFFLFAFKLSQLEMKQHFDIIHVHNMPDFLIFTGILPRLRGAKLILDLHDPMPELFMSKYDMQRGGFIRLLEIEEKISLWYAHRLITVDQSFVDIFVKRGIRANKITIVRNMPDDRFFAKLDAKRDPDHFVLIFAGTIAERYHLHDIVRAVAKVRPQVPNIQLRLVGKLEKEGVYTAMLQDLVRELQLEETVLFVPPVPLNSMPKLLAEAHLGLEPSRHDPYTDYVLPLKLLECVAVGTPCLVSRRPTIADYFDDSAVAYFDAENVDSAAARLLELAQSPDKLEAIAANARKVFDTYSWAKERARYLDLIASL